MSNVMTKFILCSEAENVSDFADLGHPVIPSQHVKRGLLCSLGIAFSQKPEKKQPLLPDLCSCDLSGGCCSSVSRPRRCTVMVLQECGREQCTLQCVYWYGCAHP